jgi:hypothetical protein
MLAFFLVVCGLPIQHLIFVIGNIHISTKKPKPNTKIWVVNLSSFNFDIPVLHRWYKFSVCKLLISYWYQKTEFKNLKKKKKKNPYPKWKIIKKKTRNLLVSPKLDAKTTLVITHMKPTDPDLRCSTQWLVMR